MKTIIVAALLLTSSLAFSETQLPTELANEVLLAIDSELSMTQLKCRSILGHNEINLNHYSFSSLIGNPATKTTVTLNDDQPIILVNVKSNYREDSYQITTNAEEKKIIKMEVQHADLVSLRENVGTIRKPKFVERKEMKIKLLAICD